MKIQYLETPHLANPINAPSGLYCRVLVGGWANGAELLDFVRADVERAGYQPDGRGLLGAPVQWGVISHAYVLWFYDKKGGAR